MVSLRCRPLEQDKSGAVLGSVLGPWSNPRSLRTRLGSSEDQTSEGRLEPFPSSRVELSSCLVLAEGGCLHVLAAGLPRLAAGSGGMRGGQSPLSRGHRLPCRLGKQAAGTGVGNSTISYLRVKNKLHPKEFHTQHPTKLVPSKTTWVLVRVLLPQPRGLEGVRAAPGEGAGGAGQGTSSPARLGGCCRFSGGGGERGGWVWVPGCWRAAVCFHRGGGVRPKGRQAGSAWLPSHRGFGSAQPAQASQNHAKPGAWLGSQRGEEPRSVAGS